DFGVNGSRPSHPQLLDWLADQFVRGGWRLKSLHREILLSSTYRQVTRAGNDSLERDGENQFLSHFSRRRLDAEEIRDSMLQVAGRLNDRAGGPSVIVPIDKDLQTLLYAPTQWI